MAVYISVYDLGLLILFAVIVAMGVYIIVVLRKVLCTLGLVQDILAEHRGDITKTFSLVQETLTNVNSLSNSLKEVTEQTNKTVHALPAEIINTVDDLKENIEVVALYAQLVVDVVKALFSKRD